MEDVVLGTEKKKRGHCVTVTDLECCMFELIAAMFLC